jgi:hypothetical protein
VLPPEKKIGLELLEVVSLQTRIELFYQHGIGGPKGVEPVISHKPEDWIPSSDEEEELHKANEDEDGGGDGGDGAGR